MADIGWITGHSYIVYGPLALGGDQRHVRGRADLPGRRAALAHRRAARASTSSTPRRPRSGCCASSARDEPAKYDYHFKHMTTVGEPIEPEVWRWYHDVVGKGEAVIVDTWWQTENGGFLGSTLPALQPMKPGSCGPGVLGIYPVIYDEDGKVVARRQRQGRQHLHPQPLARHLPDHLGRAANASCRPTTRNTAATKPATTGTTGPTSPATARCEAADGYFRILGRVDDVINVAGHRLGTKELESACLTVEEVAEAAAVPGDGRTERPRPSRCTSRSSPACTASDETGDRVVAGHRDTRSARSPARATCRSCPTCPRPAPARSCAA